MDDQPGLGPYDAPIPESPPDSPTQLHRQPNTPLKPPPLPPRPAPTGRSSSPLLPSPPASGSGSVWNRMRSVTFNGWNSISSTTTTTSPTSTPPEKAVSSSSAIIRTSNDEELDDEDLQALEQVQATLLSLGIDPTINQIRRQDDALQLKGEALAALTIPTNQVDGEWLERVRSRSRDVSISGEDERRWSAESWIGRGGDLLSPVLDEPPNGSVVARGHGFGREDDGQASGMVMGDDEAQEPQEPPVGVVEQDGGGKKIEEPAQAAEQDSEQVKETVASEETSEETQAEDPAVVVTEAAEPTTAEAIEPTRDQAGNGEESEPKSLIEQTRAEGTEEEDRTTEPASEVAKATGDQNGRNPKPIKTAPPKRPRRTPRIGTPTSDADSPSTPKASDDETDSPSKDQSPR
ncbi:BZ3500_MvSof-1268-A1-R1_Chr1-3g02041 [Microbotryum saponariae]|uniref:BZ3500_MvSof-1268-A1-R1_Chr1-3g02041 protein n=1 Tax=Microbotryum saponariae TaxID=289078 RepID=A0A2X0KU18_9BASI|nr:BZ3500_MvSof-1268-A1-R1_Chr1-3g02041 [Microbotryum saponariae]SCZ95236.1 BZ3501_MvSof-1269-A2-R1_Chr1-3g01643 [Microbotryum saponariae]